MPALSRVAPALAVILHLLDTHPSITSITLIEYQASPTFKQVARRVHRAFDQTLDRRLQHGANPARVHNIDRPLLTSNHLRRLVADLPGDRALAFGSQVILRDGQRVHIPLLDFQSSQSRPNLQRLTLAMRRLESNGGVILRSQNSYHFYGLSCLSDRLWRQFVGRSLLLEPLVDVRYLGHCLIDGHALLRISPREPGGASPSVVAIIDRAAEPLGLAARSRASGRNC